MAPTEEYVGMASGYKYAVMHCIYCKHKHRLIASATLKHKVIYICKKIHARHAIHKPWLVTTV